MEQFTESLKVILSETFEVFNRSMYSGRLFIPFLLACLMIVWAAKKKDDRALNGLVFPSWILVLILLNPVVMHYMYKSQLFERVIRLWWALPVTVVILYALTELVYSADKLWKKWAALLTALVLAFTACSGSMAGSYYIDRSENIYKIPDAVVTFSEVFHEYSDEEQPTAALPAYMARYMRQYDASVILAYGYWSPGDAFHDEMEKDEPDLDLIGGTYAAQYDCDFIVLTQGRAYTGSLEDYGYTPVQTVESRYGTFLVYMRA